MQKKLLILAYLIAIVSAAMLSNAIGAENLSKSTNQNTAGPMLKVEPGVGGKNTPLSYQMLLNASWQQYAQDFSYGSQILDKFAKNNITSNEALYATASILALTSKTIDDLNKVQPPKNLVAYHNNTLQSFIYLKEFLWDLSKYYETKDKKYAIDAKESLNKTSDYHERSIEEALINT
jgi:hypothetical protein